MIQFKIVNGSLEVINGNTKILVIPTSNVGFDSITLYDAQPMVILYNLSVGVNETIYKGLLSSLENENGLTFTVASFLNFATTYFGQNTISIVPNTTSKGVVSPYYFITTGVFNGDVINNSASSLYSITAINISDVLAYLFIYDYEGTPTADIRPIFIIPVPANTLGAGVVMQFPLGVFAERGLSIFVNDTADYTTLSAGAIDLDTVFVNVSYSNAETLLYPINFDITADWSTLGVNNELEFIDWISTGGEDGEENENTLNDVVLKQFNYESISLSEQKITCYLSATASAVETYSLFFNDIGMTSFNGCGNIALLQTLKMQNNLITSFTPQYALPSSLISLGVNSCLITDFNPQVALPSGLLELLLYENAIVNFNPSIALPSGLIDLYLDVNLIVTFNPSIALPSALQFLNFTDNQIVTFNPSIALPSGLLKLFFETNQIVTFNPSIALPSGLLELSFADNQIVTFNPSIALPNGLLELSFEDNQIVTFNPSIALPSALQYLSFEANQIVTFNPSIALPSGLLELSFADNQIVTFNPSIALPIGAESFILDLSNNQMTTLGYTNSEEWANAQPFALGREAYFNSNVDSIAGTNLEAILISKGYTITA